MKINVTEAAEITNLSQLTIRDYCVKRKIPHYKVGGKLSFVETEIRAWMDSRTERRNTNAR